MLLTKCFHVLIKILTVNQFPSGTEGVDHGGGFSGSKLHNTLSKLQLLQVFLLCNLLLSMVHAAGWYPASHWLRRFSLSCDWAFKWGHGLVDP